MPNRTATLLFFSVFVFMGAVLAGCSSKPDTASLIADLTNKDADVRCEAALELETAPDPRAVEPLIKVLSDSNDYVRANAAGALGAIADARAVPPLIERLSDPHPYVRERTSQALCRFGAAATAPLQAALAQAADAEARTQLIPLLQCIGDPRALPALVPFYGSANNDVSRAAFSALSSIDPNWKANPLAVPGLITLLDKAGNDKVRADAAQSLGKMKATSATDVLIKTSGDDNRSVAIASIIALGRIGDPKAVNALLDKLDAPDRHTAFNTVQALGAIGDRSALKPLIAMLAHKDSDLVQAVHDALKQIDAKWMVSRAAAQAVPQMIQILEKDADPQARCHAASALGAIKDKRAGAALLRAARDSHAPLRAGALSALAAMNDPRAAAPAMAGLDAPDKTVRQSAARALGKLGHRPALNRLRDTLCDRHARQAAAEALADLGWQPQTPAEKIHLLAAREEKEALLADWKTTEQVFLSDLTSGKRRVVENAYDVLANLKKEEIVPQLLRLLKTKGSKTLAEVYLNHGYPALRQAALQWAQKNGYDLIHSVGQ